MQLPQTPGFASIYHAGSPAGQEHFRHGHPMALCRTQGKGEQPGGPAGAKEGCRIAVIPKSKSSSVVRAPGACPGGATCAVLCGGVSPTPASAHQRAGAGAVLLLRHSGARSDPTANAPSEVKNKQVLHLMARDVGVQPVFGLCFSRKNAAKGTPGVAGSHRGGKALLRAGAGSVPACASV